MLNAAKKAISRTLRGEKKESASSATGRAALNLFLRAQTHRDKTLGMSRKWDRNLKWFNGDQAITSAAGSKAHTNVIYAHTMSMLPLLAVVDPHVSITPKRTAKGPAKEIAENLLIPLVNDVIVENHMTSKQIAAVLNAIIFGRGYYKIVFDGTLNRGMGAIRIETIPTKSIYKEPNTYSLSESSVIYEARELSVADLIHMFPDKREMIRWMFRGANDPKKDVYPASEIEAPNAAGARVTAPGAPASTSRVGYVWDTESGSGDRSRSTVTVVEEWIEDDAHFVETTNSESGAAVRKIRARYPYGRSITIVGKNVLQDVASEYPEFPYVEIDNLYAPEKEYGFGDIDQQIEIQRQRDIRLNQIFDSINFGTFPITILGYDSGIDPEDFINSPGKVLQGNEPQKIRRFDPTGISQSVFQSLGLIDKDMELVSGIPEAMRGIISGQIRSGAAIEQLQEAATNRLSIKTVFIERAMSELVRKVLLLAQKFYVNGEHYVPPSGLPSLDAIDLDEFRIDVTAGINQPRSKFTQRSLDQWLYDRGIIDAEYIVDNWDTIKDKDLLALRMREKWAQLGVQAPSGQQTLGG